MDHSNWLQLLYSGTTWGAIYALVALGYITIYNSSNIINFAQGEFVMLGGFFMVFFLKSVKLPYFLAIVLSVIVVALIGLAIHLLVLRPLKGSSILTSILATLGISIFLRNTSMIIWGSDPLTFPPISKGGPLYLGGAAISFQDLWVIGITLSMLVFLYLLSNYTLIGKAMKASSSDHLAANLVGISTNIIVFYAFGISAAVGAVAGIFITPIFFVSYSTGTIIGLKGFVAAVIGGWGRNTGAVVGGFLLGIVEALSLGFISAGYKNAVTFLALLVILYFIPKGILGSTETD